MNNEETENLITKLKSNQNEVGVEEERRGGLGWREN
jgi:hypothetical protein